MSLPLQSAHDSAEGRHARVAVFVGAYTLLMLLGYFAARETLISEFGIARIFEVAGFALCCATLIGALAAIVRNGRPPDRDAEMFAMFLIPAHIVLTVVVGVDVLYALPALAAGLLGALAVIWSFTLLIVFAVLSLLCMVFFQSVGPRLVGK